MKTEGCQKINQKIRRMNQKKNLTMSQQKINLAAVQIKALEKVL